MTKEKNALRPPREAFCVSVDELRLLAFMIRKSRRFDTMPIPRGIGWFLGFRVKASRVIGFRLFTYREAFALSVWECSQ